MLNFPNQVTIIEVGPREGIQNGITGNVATEDVVLCFKNGNSNKAKLRKYVKINNIHLFLEE